MFKVTEFVYFLNKKSQKRNSEIRYRVEEIGKGEASANHVHVTLS